MIAEVSQIIKPKKSLMGFNKLKSIQECFDDLSPEESKEEMERTGSMNYSAINSKSAGVAQMAET